MTWLDIVLIIIGCILVIVSFVITEKLSGNNSTDEANSVTELWGDKEEGTIKERVKNIVEDKSEEVVDTTMDRLCHMSNEKIMEFKEYADQVMESIKEEHKQAVFLYNMLSEKQEEMKKLLNSLDSRYARLSDKVNTMENVPEKPAEPEPKKSVEPKKIEPELPKVKKKTSNKAGADRNERILSLYNEGKSVLEISRLLGIGQGEVKLVIDLFKGA